MSKLKYITGAALSLAFGAALTQSVSAVTFDGPSFVEFNREITGAAGSVDNTFQYSLVSNNSEVTNLPPSPECRVYDEATAANNYTVKETCTISLSNLNISAPGKYSLTLTETGSSNASRYPVDSTNSYTINIWYRSELNSDGTPSNEKYATVMKAQNGSSKVSSIDFTSGANLNPAYVSVSNMVKGAFANTNEDFAYEVTVDGKAKDGSDLHVFIEGQGDAGTCTYSTSTLKSVCTFNLKHGQTARVGYRNSAGQIMPMGNYVVKQTPKTNYDIEIDGTASSTGQSASKTVSETSSNNLTSFVNTSNISETDTKAFFSILPYILLGAVAAISIFAVRKSKQNK